MLILFLTACTEWFLVPRPDTTDTTDTEDTDTEITLAPVAMCGPETQSIRPFETAVVSDFSYDPQEEDLVVTWELISQPAGSTINLEGTGLQRTLTPLLAGEYVVELHVQNTSGLSNVDTCVVLAEPTENLWIEMWWSHAGEDMDLHLIQDQGWSFSAYDCYFANCVGGLSWSAPGFLDDPYLDLDDITGTGPENINIQSPTGSYRVMIHDYPGSVRNETTTVNVNVYLGGILRYNGTKRIAGEDTETYWLDINTSTNQITEL